ncbi:pyridoxal-phosphate dependent enzyme [Campylobacter curvus]|uniref:1-aminocyclopropane-1-carboxylate deaminase n=1 Tax=Campylobacter curvus (strain 525.92) TaxID=360105 RepID=A7GXX8_CAMC5|nr:pyridoxal-phosphate dependent enzyme [Campylobacter curvus]EAU00209.1 1-aminocyclopropane-1-carboxylate deaminase [Campylobacter curvus 525.92]
MIEPFSFHGRDFYLLRDDLLGDFNGNKARKLEYFLNADLSGFKRIVSHGSSQSNAMYSLSLFAKIKNLEFCYVVSHLNSNLKQNPVGNFKFALENGMKIFVVEDRVKFAKELADTADALFINEGVAQNEAEYGFKTQADEILTWSEKSGVSPDIFLPSGTGTSATYLAKHIDLNVFTCPCVGDAKYLREEIAALDEHSRVKILTPPKKYHFGDLKLELYEIWQELKASGVEFELIYDPVGFITMFANLKEFKNEILYIHQGGLLGNISQKMRYERKFKNHFKKDQG